LERFLGREKSTYIRVNKVFGTCCELFVTAVSIKSVLKSQCHPKCFARRGTFLINEKYTISLIVVKSDLYLLPSLPLAILESTSVNFDLTFKCRHIDFVVYF